jgi:hypothetical protein
MRLNLAIPGAAMGLAAWLGMLLVLATGGTMLTESLFRSAPVWSSRPGWWVWLLAALGIFMIELTIRHAPALFGLVRRARPLPAGLVEAA